MDPIVSFLKPFPLLELPSLHYALKWLSPTFSALTLTVRPWTSMFNLVLLQFLYLENEDNNTYLMSVRRTKRNKMCVSAQDLTETQKVLNISCH